MSRLTRCSIQSTGGTNISLVNALSEIELYVCERNKGRGSNKRTWAIEMNQPHETYLKMYSAVDKTDQTILGYNIDYRCWKWWHALTRHAKAIAMSTAYDIYVQCSEGGVDPNWRVMPVSSIKFKQKLSLQMVQYKAANHMYPGDKRMHGATQKNKHRCGSNESSIVKCMDYIIRVAYEHYDEEKKPRRGKKSRLCLLMLM